MLKINHHFSSFLSAIVKMEFSTSNLDLGKTWFPTKLPSSISYRLSTEAKKGIGVWRRLLWNKRSEKCREKIFHFWRTSVFSSNFSWTYRMFDLRGNFANKSQLSHSYLLGSSELPKTIPNVHIVVIARCWHFFENWKIDASSLNLFLLYAIVWRGLRGDIEEVIWVRTAFKVRKSHRIESIFGHFL